MIPAGPLQRRPGLALAGATLVGEILRRAPGVSILVTSRERLNLKGEVVYPVGGLPFPVGEVDAESVSAPDVGEYAAVQLFLQHARRARPRLTVATEQMRHVLRVGNGVVHGKQATPGMPDESDRIETQRTSDRIEILDLRFHRDVIRLDPIGG